MIQTYESICIVRPTLTNDEVDKMIEKMKGVVEKNGGTILKAENWGKRKLSYNIKKEKKGIYLIFRFTGHEKVISELEHSYHVEDAVIRSLTVKVPKGDPGTLPLPSTEEGRPSRTRTWYGREDRRGT